MSLENDEIIGRLKKFKEKSGLSVWKLSNSLGIHPQTIYNWFEGRYKPSPLAIEKIQKFLRSVDRKQNEKEKSRPQG